jgi:hypothetical protein
VSGRAITDVATVEAWSSVPAADSVLLQRCIDAASEMIERECARRFTTATYTAVRHNGSDASGGRASLWLADPVTGLATPNVTSVALVTESGSTLSVALSSDAFSAATQTVCVARTGELIRVSASANEFVRVPWVSGVSNVVVTYTAGFSSAPTSGYTMPLDLEQVCCELSWLLYRDKNRVGVESLQIGGRSVSLRGALSPQSVAALDAWTIAIPRHTLVG